MPTGTTAATRQPPERRFENYILTRIVDSTAGLTNISDTEFTQLSGPPDYTTFTIGQGFCDDGYSFVRQIGFDFEFDGLTYKQFVANVNGWVALVDPTQNTFTPSNDLGGAIPGTIYINSSSVNPSIGNGSWKNASIVSTFSSQDVLLAPWFDDLRNVANAPSQLEGSPTFYSPTNVARFTSGLEPLPVQLNEVAYGVSYYHDKKNPQGRRLVIRWNCLSNFNNPTTVLKFECVIYENGTIEYRYAPRTQLAFTQGSTAESATIGIFMPNGANRWRDFAVGLGYRDTARKEYIYGGYVYSPSYTDSVPVGNEDYPATASYTVNLTPSKFWPGLNTGGSIFTFSPPVNKRKVLPRKAIRTADAKIELPLVARTGDSRLGTSLSGFDDRRSPNYAFSGSNPVVNYPTTLQRFFGGTGPGTLQRQDLFAGDFLVTGSVVKSAADAYMGELPATYIDAYNESDRHEQDQSTQTSVFYATGSAVSAVGPGFDYPLKSKTQIRFTLPVASSVQMPGVTSSIYYYNQARQCWEVPVNTTYTVPIGSGNPPSPNPGAGGDWADPLMWLANGMGCEDTRGFGPVGNIASSGSNTFDISEFNYTDPAINQPFYFGTLAQYIGKSYAKSLRNNKEYTPSAQETFTIPITAPFLVEKATFEIPMSMGPGWFNDQTQAFFPLNTGDATDFGGPGITIALMREVQQAENSPFPAVRDLIMTGTITHSIDYVSGVIVSQFPPDTFVGAYVIRPVGFLSYANPAGAVVQAPSNLSFTGSVSVEATALSVAGVDLDLAIIYSDPSTAQNASGALGLLTQPTLALAANFVDGMGDFRGSTTTQYISPFGRAGTGFAPAGRAILGNEFGTLEGSFDETGNTIPNPFYVAPSFSKLPAQMQEAITSGSKGSAFSYSAITYAPIKGHFTAPYLLMPGDKLVISISKTRPYFFNAGNIFAGPPAIPAKALSGSNLPHDVQLMPGNINITLYGSQVQEGVEFHDTLNQPLGSDACHELIGAEPVLDQFEPAYRYEYSGSFSDNVMLGTLGLYFDPIADTLVQTVRDRKLSWLTAREALPLTTASADLLINSSKAYRTEAWWERAPNLRTVQFADASERYYDSLMPSITDCFAADGSSIFIVDGTIEPFNAPFVVTGPTVGWILFDAASAANITTFGTALIERLWSKAFPFEPRYSNVSRLLDISRGFFATNAYDGATITIPTLNVPGFIFGTMSLPVSGAVSNVTPSPGLTSSSLPCFDWIADVNLNGSLTSSATPDDISRVLYGFGDRNTYFLAPGTGELLGTGHFPDSRDVDPPHPTGFGGYDEDDSFYRFSPLIRGWKYGVHSGLPTFSKAYWRHGRYGQLRDMLEQRPDGKFYQSPEKSPNVPNFQQGAGTAVVEVRFIDPSSGRLTDPANTWSSNLSFECTSSFPYFDGLALNRPPILASTLNLHPNTVTRDAFNNISVS